MHLEECKTSPVGFLKARAAHHAALGEMVKQLVTDKGNAYRTHLSAKTCQAAGAWRSFKEPHCPLANRRAVRINSTCQQERAH